MDKLYIGKTKQTPEILFEPESGILKISGRSIPENTVDFYSPITEWLEKYAANPAGLSVMKVFLEYINTSSSKYLFEIFRIFDKMSDGGHKVKVEWYYEEEVEEMKETGEDFASLLMIPFEIKIYDEGLA